MRDVIYFGVLVLVVGWAFFYNLSRKDKGELFSVTLFLALCSLPLKLYASVLSKGVLAFLQIDGDNDISSLFWDLAIIMLLWTPLLSISKNREEKSKKSSGSEKDKGNQGGNGPEGRL